MDVILEKGKNAIIQIATPYSTGTGFYLRDAGLILTNEHVVHGNREVIISGLLFQRQMTRVLYTDPLLDIAFLEYRNTRELSSLDLKEDAPVKKGDQLWIVGHLPGSELSVKEGLVTDEAYAENDVEYIQYRADMETAVSGGVVIAADGKVAGINSLVMPDEHSGWCLPARYLRKAVDDYRSLGDGKTATRCMSCLHLVSEYTVQSTRCPFCSEQVTLPSKVAEYEALGIAKTIEDILEKCGYDIRLARKGPNLWEVYPGSARVSITYYEPAGLIAGDAVLCKLPQRENREVFEYLLRQNHEIEGLTLSVKGCEVVLSLIIVDRYLDVRTGVGLFKRLFQKADDIDNVLVERYGCGWVRGGN